MIRAISLTAALALGACTTAGSPASPDDQTIADGKGDGIATASIDPKLAPMLAFLRDDANLLAQLGPPDTVTAALTKKIKVVSYTEFGHAVNLATHEIARNYQVSVATGNRTAYALIDLFSVPDMYLEIKTGYGDDSFVDKLVATAQRTKARGLLTTLLPDTAVINANQASETSTGNYVLVLGDVGSQQAIVMTLAYQVN